MALPSLKERVPELDGLRGVAILLVIVYHYLEPVHRAAQGWHRYALAPARIGWLGVNLFFVLSGYLIGSILMANRESPAFFRTFYLRRFCRILPLYVVVVLGCFAAHYRYMRTPGEPLYQYLTFTQNFTMAATGQFGIPLLAITWSLAVEEQFYLLLPPLVRFNRPKRLLAIVIGCMLLAPVLRYFFIAKAGQHGMFAAQVLLFAHLDGLMLGVLFAWMRTQGVAIPRRLVRVVWWISAALAAYSAVSTPAPRTVSPLQLAVFYEVFIVCCASTLLMAVDGRFPFLRWKALTYTGLISYGLYLMHQPVNWGLHWAFRWQNWNDVRLVLVSFPVVYLAAALSWHLFEKPFVRFSHRFRYHDGEQQGAAFAAPEPSTQGGRS